MGIESCDDGAVGSDCIVFLVMSVQVCLFLHFSDWLTLATLQDAVLYPGMRATASWFKFADNQIMLTQHHKVE